MTIHTIVALDLNVIALMVEHVGIRLEMLKQQRHVNQVNGNAKYNLLFCLIIFNCILSLTQKT